ncbi:uncharacterized protein LOC142282556 isoform X1 [Anomaloglossus baeobatrachus]|uniref:uncharacterized protein LOC142282556 isoform X1 n=1 Tax=Anomaloglossus baeobatrachus TaxID=238106 RepID=UPI003F505AC4
MQFAILLFVSLLLASVEGAPINTSRHDSRALIPAEYHTALYISAVVLVLSGFFLGFICIILCRHLIKSKFWIQITSRYSTDDDDIKSGANPSGEKEEKTPLIDDGAPHGPMDDQRDVLTTTDISMSGPHYVAINMDPYEDVIVSSDKEQEDKMTNLNDGGPMAETRDVIEKTNISTAGPHYVITDIDHYEDVTIASDKEQEDGITNVIDYAPQGLMDENQDVFEDIDISTPGPFCVIINNVPDEDEIIASNKEREGAINIASDDVPHEPMAEKREVLEKKYIARAKASMTSVCQKLLAFFGQNQM